MSNNTTEWKHPKAATSHCVHSGSRGLCWSPRPPEEDTLAQTLTWLAPSITDFCPTVTYSERQYVYTGESVSRLQCQSLGVPPAPLLICCVIERELLHVSVPQSPHL